MARPQASDALARFTVLDLTQVRSGPTAVRQLADWGANVIKIDSAHRNPVNWHNEVNRGKRMIHVS